jgi:hypothetical protein
MRAAGQGPGRFNVNAADCAATAPGDAAKMLRDIVLRAIARLCALSRACDMSAVVVRRTEFVHRRSCPGTGT